MPGFSVKQRIALRERYIKYPFLLLITALAISLILEVSGVFSGESSFTMIMCALMVLGFYDLYFCLVYRVSQTGMFNFSPEANIVTFVLGTVFSIILMCFCIYTIYGAIDV